MHGDVAALFPYVGIERIDRPGLDTVAFAAGQAARCGRIDDSQERGRARPHGDEDIVIGTDEPIE